MTVGLYELIVVVLVALVIALVVAMTLLSRKSVDVSAEQFPAGTMDKLQKLLELALGLATRTATPVDDAGLKLLAETLGFTVTVGENGVITLAKVRSLPPPGTSAS